MKNWVSAVAALGLAGTVCLSAHATIIAVGGPASSAGGTAMKLLPPPAALNSSIFANAQRGFDEQQNVLLTSAITVDGGGFIAAGTLVNSHLILLNKDPQVGGQLSHTGVQWLFDGMILGVMSDGPGALEAASTDQLGSTTTLYPTVGGPDVGSLGGLAGGTYAGYGARGMEGPDGYVVAGNALTVDMVVSEPGDWIRVVTAAEVVPEPDALALLSVGLLVLIGAGRGRARAS